MSLLTSRRIIGAKIESTSGTAETLTNSESYVTFDPVIQADADFMPRETQGKHIPGVVGLRGGTCTFKVELVCDGAGGVPAWADCFLPACGWVKSTQTFTPRLEAPGSNVKTLTIAVYENGLRKMLRGAVGTFKLVQEAGMRIFFDFTFRGAFQAVADVTALTNTPSTQKPLRFANVTWGGYDPGCIQSLEIDAGNNIILRECPSNSDATGYATGLITGRRIVGKMNPEAKLVASDDVFGEWFSGVEENLVWDVENATDKVTFTIPKAQRFNVQEGERNGLQINDIDFQCNQSSGNDEFSILFGAP